MTRKREYFHLAINHKYYENLPHAGRRHAGAAAYWLDCEQRAVVFYGPSTAEEIRSAPPGEQPNQAILFFSIADEQDRYQDRIIATVQEGQVWVYRCTAGIKNGGVLPIGGKGQDEPDRAKSFPIQLISAKRLSEVPPVLANIKANKRIGMRTFEKLSDRTMIGNIAAIQAACGEWEEDFKVDPLDCLASVELETLVAKLFEAIGCFVPAARGGVMPGVDLFAWPRAATGLNELRLQKKDHPYSIQVKKSYAMKKKSATKDPVRDWLISDQSHLLITLQKKEDRLSRHFGREWLREAINQTPTVTEWLIESLKWLPLERQDPPLGVAGLT